MQIDVRAFGCPQVRDLRYRFDSQRGFLAQSRGDAQFVWIILAPVLQFLFAPPEPFKFFCQNPVGSRLRCLKMQLSSMMLPCFFAHEFKHALFKGRFPKTPAPPQWPHLFFIQFFEPPFFNAGHKFSPRGRSIFL